MCPFPISRCAEAAPRHTHPFCFFLPAFLSQRLTWLARSAWSSHRFSFQCLGLAWLGAFGKASSRGAPPGRRRPWALWRGRLISRREEHPRTRGVPSLWFCVRENVESRTGTPRGHPAQPHPSARGRDTNRGILAGGWVVSISLDLPRVLGSRHYTARTVRKFFPPDPIFHRNWTSCVCVE